MNEKTEQILTVFEAINQIPRCSKNEEQVSAWLLKWAAANEFDSKQDKAGNLVVKVPPTKGYETKPGIIFQAHVDMVCEKTPESPHDFNKDPIRHVLNGDWLSADQTTLGADNGAAVAIGMVLAEDKTVAHPPLELLFTVDEETGLNGARLLEPSLVEGKILLNVDSEDEGVFTVGCAGGQDTEITLKCDGEPPTVGHRYYKVLSSGMRGGHSGIDIDKHRANANQVLARALACLQDGNGLRLVAFKGGTVHNAIPRDAEAVIACGADQSGDLENRLAEFETTVRKEFAGIEPNLTLSVAPVDLQGEAPCVISPQKTSRVLNLLLALPHGVAEHSLQFTNLVQTSSNLAVVTLAGGRLKINTSQRSSILSRLDALTRSIEGIAALAGADVKTDKGYPAWPPNLNSPLLARCKAVYSGLYGKEPVVEVIHAGLECGVIGAICPGLDMISFGPTMENPHSPGERLFIPSLEKVWAFLVALLASFGEANG